MPGMFDVLRAAMRGAGRGIARGYHGDHVSPGLAYGGVLGPFIGGAIDYATSPPSDNDVGAGVMLGMLGGMGLGVGGGAAAKGLSMLARGGAGGLREALEALAQRGVGSSEALERATGFTPGAPRAFAPDELDAIAPPSPRYGSGEHRMDRGRADPMAEMSETQAMRNSLMRLQRERRTARSQEELDDIDLEIAVIRRDLGL